MLDTKPDLAFPMPLGERSVPGGAMLLVALILALCGYGTWYYVSTSERSRPVRVIEVPPELAAAASRASPEASRPWLPATEPSPEAQLATTPDTTTLGSGGSEPASSPGRGRRISAMSRASALARRPRHRRCPRLPLRSQPALLPGLEPRSRTLTAPSTERPASSSGLRPTAGSDPEHRPGPALHAGAEGRRKLPGARSAGGIDAHRQCRRSGDHGRRQTDGVDRPQRRDPHHPARAASALLAKAAAGGVDARASIVCLGVKPFISCRR